jgi:hypothetical protein
MTDNDPFWDWLEDEGVALGIASPSAGFDPLFSPWHDPWRIARFLMRVIFRLRSPPLLGMTRDLRGAGSPRHLSKQSGRRLPPVAPRAGTPVAGVKRTRRR